MYLFTVSNCNVFLLKSFWCTRIDFAAQAMVFSEDELKAAQSPAMDTGSGSDLDLLSFACLSLTSVKPKHWIWLPMNSSKLWI